MNDENFLFSTGLHIYWRSLSACWIPKIFFKFLKSFSTVQLMWLKREGTKISLQLTEEFSTVGDDSAIIPARWKFSPAKFEVSWMVIAQYCEWWSHYVDFESFQELRGINCDEKDSRMFSRLYKQTGEAMLIHRFQQKLWENFPYTVFANCFFNSLINFDLWT